MWIAAAAASPEKPSHMVQQFNEGPDVIAREAPRLISALRIDQEVADELLRRIEAIGPPHIVAVRLPLPRDAVSGPECSGIYASYTNVFWPDQILSSIRSCWASLFGERALMYRSCGLSDAQPSIAASCNKWSTPQVWHRRAARAPLTS